MTSEDNDVTNGANQNSGLNRRVPSAGTQNINTDRQRDRQTDRQTDRLTDRLTGWLAGWLAGWLRDRQTDRQKQQANPKSTHIAMLEYCVLCFEN
jgi:hypothetical protein